MKVSGRRPVKWRSNVVIGDKCVFLPVWGGSDRGLGEGWVADWPGRLWGVLGEIISWDRTVCVCVCVLGTVAAFRGEKESRRDGMGL